MDHLSVNASCWKPREPASPGLLTRQRERRFWERAVPCAWRKAGRSLSFAVRTGKCSDWNLLLEVRRSSAGRTFGPERRGRGRPVNLSRLSAARRISMRHIRFNSLQALHQFVNALVQSNLDHIDATIEVTEAIFHSRLVITNTILNHFPIIAL